MHGPYFDSRPRCVNRKRVTGPAVDDRADLRLLRDADTQVQTAVGCRWA